MRSLITIAAVVGTLFTAVPRVTAQQPLEAFLAAGRAHALDLREAELNREIARSQVDEARARWLPSFTASGGYTRNEVDVVVTIPTGATTSTQATITPLDQADLTLQLNVPVIDVGAWLDFAAAEASAEAGDRRAEATRAETDLAIATAYHQVLATRALLDAAVRGRGAAQASLERARARVSAELASDLEVARAEAEVARVDQQIADAELQVTLAERNLEVLTGLAVGDERTPTLEDDLVAPPETTGDVDALAEVRAADADVRAARLSRDASWAALAPTVSAFARERITNAAGFGPSAVWALGVQATFTLDFLRPARIGTRERQEDLAALRRERALETARTRVTEARARLVGSIARVRAARAQEASARRARDVAVSRFESQLAAQLDVLTAERELVSAEGTRIQAEGDLAVARLAYRVRTTGTIDGSGPVGGAR
jgi:outer membrane protein TolC